MISLVGSTSTLTNEGYESVNLFAGRKTPDQNDTDDKVGFLYDPENPFEGTEKDESTQMAILTGTKHKTSKKNPKRRAPLPPHSKHPAGVEDKKSASVIGSMTDKMMKP